MFLGRKYAGDKIETLFDLKVDHNTSTGVSDENLLKIEEYCNMM